MITWSGRFAIDDDSDVGSNRSMCLGLWISDGMMLGFVCDVDGDTVAAVTAGATTASVADLFSVASTSRGYATEESSC